jgi:hypothetical protein
LRPGRVTIALFLLAVVVRLAFALAAKTYDEPAYSEAVMVARSIADSGSFANPFAVPTGPTGHVAPVYPYLLAAILKLFPWGHGFAVASMLLGVLGSSLIWAALPVAAECLGIDWRAGAAGGLLGAVNLFRHSVELTGVWEAPYAALALLGLTVLTFRWRDRFTETPRSLALGGCWGAAMLLQPAFITVFVAFLLILTAGTRRIRPAALALVAMAVVVTPWIIRNEIMLGGFTFVRSNFGLELDLANNDHAAPGIGENFHTNQALDHPDVNRPEAHRMAEMGEMNYYHSRLKRALAWISGHPARFLVLCGQRLWDYWIPVRRSLKIRIPEFILTAMAATGLLLLLKSRQPAAAFLLAIWISQPLVYYFIQVDERYRYPMEWTIALCAGYLLLRTAEAVAPAVLPPVVFISKQR